VIELLRDGESGYREWQRLVTAGNDRNRLTRRLAKQIEVARKPEFPSRACEELDAVQVQPESELRAIDAVALSPRQIPNTPMSDHYR
jgi:hypothetical protein